MKIFPAIDLRGGKVVRLLKGDYDQMTVFGDDPLAAAKKFAAAGAEFLHVVDLDGAKDGDNPNFDVVRALALESGLKVEIGGGIRSEETIKRYLDAGVWRVILGTIAVKDPDFTADMIRKYGGRVAVGVDIDGRKAADPRMDRSVRDHGGSDLRAAGGRRRQLHHLYGYFQGRGHGGNQPAAVQRAF